jgi:hypothetical protein
LSALPTIPDLPSVRLAGGAVKLRGRARPAAAKGIAKCRVSLSDDARKRLEHRAGGDGMDEDLKARLDAVESRAQIAELPAKYVWASARADVPAMMVLFTEDCDFEMGPADGRIKLKGRDAVHAVMSKSLTKPGGIIALIQNQIIELHGDTATGTCAMFNPIAPPANSPFVGYYKDEFRRENGVWLFSARRFWTYSPVLDLSGG